MSDPFDFDAWEAPSPAETAAGRPSDDARHLEALNESQRSAVEAVDGPVLVLAGAGTGKTRVLTTRLAHILITGRAWPNEILAVTFTNKAALEMRERVGALIGRAADGLWLGTFHSIGVRILRRHAELVGLKSNFVILDTDDQIRLIKQLLQANDVDDKKWPARVLSGIIQRWKDRGLSPEKVTAAEDVDFANGRALEIYRQYQERLAQLNAVDFGDLLLLCLELFTAHKDVLEEYRQRFRYILVDEYQDTNVAQYLWLRLLAKRDGQPANICCVGDDDQSIYGWRGAEVGNILRFEEDFPGARVIRLERNYRSTPHILGAASGLIAQNEGRLGKTLWTDLDEGEKVQVRGVWDAQEEARTVGEEIEALQRKGAKLSDVAILVRAGFQTREFEERFLTIGLPYRVIGGPRFYERQEIRDAMAYLRVLVTPEDDLAFERIVNVPKRGLGAASVQTLQRAARAAGLPLLAAARDLVATDELGAKARNALRGLVEDFDRWRAMLDGVPHTELVETVLEESGYTAMWQADRSPEAPGRLENLRELVNAIAEFENLPGFLEHVSLVMENTENAGGDMVSLMTLHGAKGLEFDTVFLPGWEEGVFPNQRALDESGAAGLEEERRLAYVGLTRARKRAIVSFAASRQLFGQWQSSIPSRFVRELPEEHVEQIADSGLYGSYGGLREEGHFGWSERATPGAARLRRNRERLTGTRAPTIEGEAFEVTSRGGAAGAYAIGQRIFHQKFGYGRVADIEGNRLDIEFEKAGRKKVFDSFVEPA